MTSLDAIIHLQGSENNTTLCGGKSGSGITVTAVKAHVDCARCRAIMEGRSLRRTMSAHHGSMTETSTYLNYGGK
jgi:hypothetical protein